MLKRTVGYKILFKKRNVNIRGSLRPGIELFYTFWEILKK